MVHGIAARNVRFPPVSDIDCARGELPTLGKRIGGVASEVAHGVCRSILAGLADRSLGAGRDGYRRPLPYLGSGDGRQALWLRFSDVGQQLPRTGHSDPTDSLVSRIRRGRSIFPRAWHPCT